MNKTHKSIWNEALGAYVAASEIAAGSGGRTTSKRRPDRAATPRMALEPRIVFDGALPVALMDGAVDGGLWVADTQGERASPTVRTALSPVDSISAKTQATRAAPLPGDAKFEALLTPTDVDDDGVANDADADDDNDGILDATEGTGDTDGDGVIDARDLDSDNDGISDLVESGQSALDVDRGRDGKVDGGVNGSGVPTLAGAGATPRNSDGDSRPDYLDLDSDNDGIADTVEARTTFGYLANDGDVSNDDTDGDGVISLFERGAGFDGNFNAPTDTDNDGIADYRETDSDGDGKLDSVESGLSAVTTDANGDGIRDSVGASYQDPDGIVNNPRATLDNEASDTFEVGYREFDTDKDGLFNQDDLDDDNDGILDSVETPNTLINGNFEDRAGLNNGNNIGVDIAPWVLGTGNRANIVKVDGAGGYDYGFFGPASDADPSTGDGVIQHYLDIANGANDFYQTFTLIDAAVVEFSGYFSSRGTAAGAETGNGSISIRQGIGTTGTLLARVGVENLRNNTSWTQVFESIKLGSGTYSFVVAMDNNVNFDLAIARARYDTDGDGLDNSIDLDSDNDGISDLVESGQDAATKDANNDGVHDGGVNASTGIPVSAGAGLSAVVNTDRDLPGGDLRPDYLDLDSDNDGIADTVEARLTAGYAPNDGNVSNDDADRDGIISLFDSGSTFGGNFTPPVDTDRDGTADYLDADSDGDGLLDSAESGLSSDTTDENNDGIRDSVGASYQDPDGNVNNPQVNLANQAGDTSEVGYRESPPVAITPSPVPGLEDGGAVTVRLTGTDIDGTVVSVRVTTLPPASQGVLTLDNGTPLVAGAVLTPAQAANLRFVPAPNFNGVVNVPFTVTDNKGLVSAPATAVINITPVDDVVSVGGLSDGALGGTDAQVRESDLDAGSAPTGTGESTVGSFTLGPLASLRELSIGGRAITLAELTGSGATPIVISGTYGTLTVTGYNSTTQAVSYSYVLTSPANHGAGVVNDSFAIATTDVDGDAGTASLAINIVDDAPVARADRDEVINVGGNPSSVASGNVATGVDVSGGDPNSTDGVADGRSADGTVFTVVGVSTSGGAPGTVGVALPGTYGSLTLNSNGSYTYTPNYLDPTVSGLSPGTTLTDTFRYRIGDGDGAASSTADLTITIVGVPAVVGLGDGATVGTVRTDGRVLESDLASGTNAAGLGETLNGSFQLVSPSFGVAELTVGSRLITTTELAGLALPGAAPIAVSGGTRGDLLITGYDSTTGNVSYRYTLTTPANNAGPATEDFAVFFKDTAGNSTLPAGTKLSIEIVNDAPLATNDVASMDENASPATVTGNVLGNDVIGADGPSTAPAGPVTGVAAGAAVPVSGAGVSTGVAGAYGSINVAADGSYTYTLDASNPAVDALRAGDSLTDTFTYQITDADGDTTTATITVTVKGANDAPVALDNTYTVGEDAGAGFIGNALTDGGPAGTDSDPDGDVLSVVPQTGVAGSNGGVFSIEADGTVRFDPSGAFNDLAEGETRTTTLTYQISDGEGGTDTAVITVTVTGANDAPAAQPDVKLVAEDTPLTGQVLTNDIDPDGNPITVTSFSVGGTTYPAGTVASLPGVGTVVINADGTYTFTPLPNFNGPVPVVGYTVSDGGLSTAGGTLTLGITPVNDSPVAADDVKLVPEDTPATGNVLGNDSDPEGAGLTLTGFTVGGVSYAPGATATLPGVGSLVLNADGSYTFTPVANFNGAVPPVTYTLSDGSATATATLKITVAPTNDAPLAQPDVNIVDEDTPATGNLLGNDIDPDGNPLVVAGFSVAGSPTVYKPGQIAVIPNVGTLQINDDGSYVFTPVANFNGRVPQVSYSITDGDETASSTLDISVMPGNDGPKAQPDVKIVAEDTPATGNVLGNDVDPDGNPLVVTAFTVGGVTYAPGELATIPGVGTVQLRADGSYTFTPAPNFSGPVPPIGYTATDGVETSSSTLNITVTPVNDPPSAQTDAQVVPEDTPATGNVLGNDRDPDGNPLVVTTFTVGGTTYAAGEVATLPGVGSFQLNADGSYTFTPAPDFSGPVPKVDYTITDGAQTATSSLSLTVSPVNDPPVPAPDTNSGAEDTPITGNLLANDTDPERNPLVVTAFSVGGVSYPPGSVVALPGVGTLVINADGSYVFNPAPNFSGPVPAISYTVSDGVNTAGPAALNLSITPVNDAPVAEPNVQLVPEDTPARGNVLGNDRDPEGSPLSVTGFSVGGTTYAAGATATLPNVGTITLNADGSYVFTPTAQFNGPVPKLTYTLSDGSQTATATLDINVIPSNDPPLAGVDGPVQVEGGTVGTGSVLTNDTDPDGDPIIVTNFTVGGTVYPAGTPVDIPGVGTLVVQANGQYRFTPVSGFTGPTPSFGYTITDGRGTATGSISFLVTDPRLNDPQGDAISSGDYHRTLGMTAPAESSLHVAFAVSDARNLGAMGSGLGLSGADSVTQAELLGATPDNLLLSPQQGVDLVGEARGSRFGEVILVQPADYVIKAARHQALTTDSLHVQHAVRSSQLEAQGRDRAAAAYNSATPGVSSLFDPFALGRPAPVVEAPRPAAEPSKDKKASAAEPEVRAPIVASQMQAPPGGDPPGAAPPSRAAPSFISQLRQAANQLPRHKATSAKV